MGSPARQADRPVIPVAAAGVIAVLLLHQPAAANPCQASVAQQADRIAPCSGLLIPEGDARAALRCMSVTLPRCRADGVLCAAEAAARAKGARAMMVASEAHRGELQGQVNRLLSLEPRAWWDSPGVWFGAGAAAGVGAVIAILKAIEGS